MDSLGFLCDFPLYTICSKKSKMAIIDCTVFLSPSKLLTMFITFIFIIHQKIGNNDQSKAIQGVNNTPMPFTKINTQYQHKINSKIQISLKNEFHSQEQKKRNSAETFTQVETDLSIKIEMCLFCYWCIFPPFFVPCY